MDWLSPLCVMALIIWPQCLWFGGVWLGVSILTPFKSFHHHHPLKCPSSSQTRAQFVPTHSLTLLVTSVMWLCFSSQHLLNTKKTHHSFLYSSSSSSSICNHSHSVLTQLQPERLCLSNRSVSPPCPRCLFQQHAPLQGRPWSVWPWGPWSGSVGVEGGEDEGRAAGAINGGSFLQRRLLPGAAQPRPRRHWPAHVDRWGTAALKGRHQRASLRRSLVRREEEQTEGGRLSK